MPFPASGLPAAVSVAVSVALPPGGTAPLGPVSLTAVATGAAVAAPGSSNAAPAAAAHSRPARPHRSLPASLIYG